MSSENPKRVALRFMKVLQELREPKMALAVRAEIQNWLAKVEYHIEVAEAKQRASEIDYQI